MYMYMYTYVYVIHITSTVSSLVQSVNSSSHLLIAVFCQNQRRVGKIHLIRKVLAQWLPHYFILSCKVLE